MNNSNIKSTNTIPMTKHNIIILIACFIPVYLVVSGVIVFYYLNMDYSPLALIISVMFANLFTYLNLKSVTSEPITNRRSVTHEKQ